MLTATLVSLSVVFVAELGDIPTADHDPPPPVVGRAVRRRHRLVPGARAVGDDRPFPRAHIAGTPDRVRRGHRLPVVRGVDVAGASHGRRQGCQGRRTATRAARVISSFVLAELGDKTMLATVALASDHWAGVWIGATAGMVLADGVAIAVGAVLHKRLPDAARMACASCSSGSGCSFEAQPLGDCHRGHRRGRRNRGRCHRRSEPSRAFAGAAAARIVAVVGRACGWLLSVERLTRATVVSLSIHVPEADGCHSACLRRQLANLGFRLGLRERSCPW